jgi:curved DNA-binding protein CbpA
MADRTPYEVLGVAKDATAEQIKKAYRRRSSEAHPDRQDGDARQMQEVNDAYALLSNDVRRRLYDETGETGKEGDLTDIAKGLLASELSKIVDGEPWGDPIMALRAAIDAIQATSITAYANHVDRIKTLKARSRSFVTSASAEDFLRPVFVRRIEEAESALKACEKLNDAAKRARELLESYRFEDYLRAQMIGWLRP